MASALDTARATIEARIQTLWVDANGDARTRVAWGNKTFAPPDSDAWIKVDLTFGDTTVATKNGANSIVGLLTLNVFVPHNTGTGTLYGLADNARDMLNRVEVSGVRFDAPSGPGPTDESDERWVRAAVVTTFTIEETV